MEIGGPAMLQCVIHCVLSVGSDGTAVCAAFEERCGYKLDARALGFGNFLILLATRFGHHVRVENSKVYSLQEPPNQVSDTCLTDQLLAAGMVVYACKHVSPTRYEGPSQWPR